MKELTFEQAVNMDNFTFRFSVLQLYSSKELSKWLKTYYKDIQQHVISRFRFLAESNPNFLKIAARIPYLKDAYSGYRKMGLEKNHLLPFAHYIALFGLTCGTGSMHEVLFGEEKPVELRMQECALADEYSKLSPNLKTAVLFDLCSELSRLSNPVYLSHSRYNALAKEAGRQLNQWFIEYSTTPDRFRQTIGFTPENIPFTDPLDSHRDISVGASSLWWMALLICPKLDISVDYLYRLDYSAIAERNGKPLSDMEQMFLSAYLLASEDKQYICRLTMLEHCLDITN